MTASSDRDEDLAALFFEREALQALARVASRLARLQVELPHVLEARQELAIAHAFRERDVFVRAHRLERDEAAAGVDDDRTDALRGDFLDAVDRHVGGGADAM